MKMDDARLAQMVQYQKTIHAMIREENEERNRARAKGDLYAFIGFCIVVAVIIFGYSFEPVEPPRYIEETPCVKYETQSTMVPKSFTGGINPSGWSTIREEVCVSYGKPKIRPNPAHIRWEQRKAQKSK